MTRSDDLYRAHSTGMEDFWSRRGNAPRFERTLSIFGHPVTFASNDRPLLGAADVAARLYSTAPWENDTPWRVTLVVHDPPRPPGPPPDRLIDRLHYAGAGEWLSIELAGWGSCFVDLQRGEAHAVIASSLAIDPALVSQLLLNTILTNFITRHGFGMLHASALVKDGRALLLLAPHGTGKSTTALRLLLHGYQLLTDSMVYVGEHAGSLWLGGFPVGRIKLRRDMLAHFPALAAEARPEPVRDETKHRLELDRLTPERTHGAMVSGESAELCLLERGHRSQTDLEPLSPDELWPQIMLNSLHFDTPAVWQANLSSIGLLIERAHLHRLRIGTSEAAILSTVDKLWNSGP